MEQTSFFHAGPPAVAASGTKPAPGVQLRPYQQDAREAVEQEWERGNTRTLLVLPTGCGKTVVFAKITEDCVRKGQRVLILAHRGELLTQAADKLEAVTGLRCAVEKAEETCLGSWYRVVVGSVQSLQRQKRLDRFPADYFGTIIIDEAHHALTAGYQCVVNHFRDANVLGVTATPDRGDMRSLGAVFDSLAYEYTLPKAIKEGYLCPILAQTIPLELDISGVAMSGGDFAAGGIGAALEPYLDRIADEMARVCADRKTVAFLPLVKISQQFRDVLNAHGFRAAEVNGESSDRQEVLAAFDRGEYNVLCNSMLLTEGWDCPSVDCVVILRPTKVRGLYCQMVGRGTRLYPGKKDLLLLDFLWLTERHELCRPAALICENQEVADKMAEITEAAGGPVELTEAENRASEEVVEQRKESLAKELAAQRKKKARLVDPLQFEMSINAEDLANYTPAFAWQMAPPTDNQLMALEKAGINAAEVGNAGKAALLLDRIALRRREGLSTPKQIRLLEQRGFRDVGTWSFDTASQMISRISAAGWKVPRGINPAEYRPERNIW